MNISKGSTRGKIILIGMLFFAGIVYFLTKENHPIIGFILTAAILYVAYICKKAVSGTVKEEKFLESYKTDLPGIRIALLDLKDEITFLEVQTRNTYDEEREGLEKLILKKKEEAQSLSEQIELYEKGKELIKERYKA